MAIAEDDPDAEVRFGLVTLSSSISGLLLRGVAAGPIEACCIVGPEQVEAVDEDNAGDVVALGVTTIDGLLTLPVTAETLFNSEPIDSSRCHLELRAEFI